MHFPDTPYLYILSYVFHTNCFCQLLFFFRWLIFLVYYVFELKTLITLILLIWVFIFLAASFDNIWNSMEYVINLDNIWRHLSKTFDIWVERWLTIFNDNLAIFYDRNVHTGARKLSFEKLFYSIQFKNGWLATSDLLICLHNQLSSIITFY